MDDGDSHAHTNMPVLIGGSGGGVVKTGRHMRVPTAEPVANLFLSILQGMGVEATSFGADGTRPLAGLAG
ncbi:MAG: hypothetical protein R3F39_00905 [Myxococcota bacterium]